MQKIKNRLETLDTLRGLTMISMILYHFCWDLKYIAGLDMDWYGSFGAFLWQQSICWTFILLAGFCMNFARQPIRNGLIVFLCGFMITCATLIFIPGAAVYFGVLTMLGSSMILLGAVMFLQKKINPHEPKENEINISPYGGFIISMLLFAITKPINNGVLNLFVFKPKLPSLLYINGGDYGMDNLFLTYLGFKQDGFYSSDYFSLIPWFFLFCAGYFLYGVLSQHFNEKYFHIKLRPIAFLGRHSLIVYLLHQPILYALTMLIFRPTY